MQKCDLADWPLNKCDEVLHRNVENLIHTLHLTSHKWNVYFRKHLNKLISCLTQQVDTVVNPLKKTVSSVGNMVKSMPDNIVDGVVKVSGGIRSIPSNMIDGVGKMLNVKPVINMFSIDVFIMKPYLVFVLG